MNETLHEMAVRMCRGRCSCTNCPIRTEIKGPTCLISCLSANNADALLDALRKWASEHSRKTWLDLLREKMPDSRYAKDHVAYPSECPSVFFGGDAPHYVTCSRSDCRECWNSEAEMTEE